MADSKNLYFIPIIAQALNSDDPKRAMERAFDEIRMLGDQPKYREGFRQFLEFVKAAVKPSGEEPEWKNQLAINTIHGLIYDLVTDTFDGGEDQQRILLTALKNNFEWNAEYERLKDEAKEFLSPEALIEIEVIKGDKEIGSISTFKDSGPMSPISPGKYMFRFSNGRVLWEGDITREDVIWKYAFPGKGLAMAAETDHHHQVPTRIISLLDGELIIYVFAGLESGRIKIKSGKRI